MQQSVTEEIGHIPHDQPYEKNKYFTGDQYLIDPFLFIGAQILAGKAQTGLIKGIHGGINKAFQIAGCGAARHGDGTEGVDGRLDQYVGNRENSALHSCRQADAYHLHKLIFMNMKLV